ncbi:MAG TPA: branched-chain-amino-acid transaminase [Methylomirabilota bacterium]|nr:branched-chain-amino-acid transaminase [Methylomirabilota bacterium]
MTTGRYVYLNGELVPYADARIHVQSTAVKYGGSVFEGLRAYWNPAQEELYVFRLQEHIDRLFASMRLMRMQHSLTREEIGRSILDVLRKNQAREDVHIRQTAYLSSDGDMDDAGPVGLAVDARPRKATQKPGIAVGVSSWTRIADGAMPPRIKCSANYQNGRLATLEAKANGYDGALLLNGRGKLAEAPGACCFLLRGGVPITPPVTADILESVTRATLIELFRTELGQPALEREVDRTELYLADEVFLCGSGWEITPVVSIDRLPLGDGVQPGPVTRAIQACYFAVVRGEKPAYRRWLTPVYGR